MEDDHVRKWSWVEFILGWINKKFLAFIIITGFVNKAIFDGQSDDVKKLLVILWGVVTIVWMLSGALEKMISKGNLNVEAKLGASVSK